MKDKPSFPARLAGWEYQYERAEKLEQQNADLLAALDVFFKVVVVDGQEYRPGLPLCAGCPHLTIARGWECFYKPLTTECKYPDLLIEAGLTQKANKEGLAPKEE